MGTLIKSFLAPYEVYLWAGAAVLLLVLGVKINSDLRDHYQAQLLAADAKAVALENQLKAKVEADAQNTLDPANSILHVALDAPAPVAAFTLRVCPGTGPSGAQSVVPANGGAGLGSGASSTVVPGSVGSVAQGAGVDIVPTTEQLLARADAEIAYWRKYYADCKAHGICK